jgi:uncharacterized protein (DUF305 family)
MTPIRRSIRTCCTVGSASASALELTKRFLSVLAIAVALATPITGFAATAHDASNHGGSVSLSSPGLPAKSNDEAAYLATNDAAMTKMMNDMAVKPTGDIDHDFVAMMVPHHQGAIDMAQVLLRYGRNEQLRRIAQDIVVEQLQEIAAMHAASGANLTSSEVTLAANSASAAPGSRIVPPGKADDVHPSLEAERSFLAENDAAMTKMMNDMTVKPTGDVDRDFVAMMVPHHQGAIGMAEAELRFGHVAPLKRIAQEIIVDQIQEIALMRLAVGEALPPSVASPTNPSPRPQAPSPVADQTPMKMDGSMRMSPKPQ